MFRISPAKITNSRKMKACKWLDYNERSPRVIHFNFRKVIFPLSSGSLKQEHLDNHPELQALLVQFKSSLWETETMTHRIKTWAYNVPVWELEIFVFLKLCGPACVTWPPSPCISFAEKSCFPPLISIVWEKMWENGVKPLANNNTLKYIKYFQK